MSSNIRIKKVCKHCNKLFIAKTTVTGFCSDQCAKNNYKKRQRDVKVEQSEAETQLELAERPRVDSGSHLPIPMPELLSISSIAEFTNLSERTLFRLLKDPTFPRVKVGRRLLFRKDAVIDYLTSKYGSV